MLRKFVTVAAVSLVAVLAARAEAMPLAHPVGNGEVSSLVVPVADGCGAGRYRGPYGSCHRFGAGPYPNGYWGHPQWYRPWTGVTWNGCPPGFWRGPWGHCRDTPYHGRLPGGGWK